MAGVSVDIKTDLLNTTGFGLGTFPMKYLGVPLISTRLSQSDCQPLLEKILGRIHSWTSRALSYAGRLQLIGSVLYSIQQYWCNMFIIPKFFFFFFFFLDNEGVRASLRTPRLIPRVP